jgi:protoporphyrinogen oxidase
LDDRIVIIGAGPTGLGAAYRLSELGVSSWEIYERNDHVGGLAASYRDEHGFIWDHGGHVMFSHYSYFDDLVEKMLRGDYDQHMREAWVWLQQRFVPYPFQNNIHRLPEPAFVECFMGIVEAQRLVRPKSNFAEWISAIFGDGIARHFMVPYNLKVWAHPLELMDTQWQGDRVPEVDLHRILENQVYGRDDVAWGPNNKFKFPLLGTGMLYTRMSEALPKQVNLGSEVVEIDAHDRRVTFSDGSVVAYDTLVTTMPLTELVTSISACPDEVREAAEQLCHTEGFFVGIGVADPCPSSKCWMYFPEPAAPFYRVTYLSNYSPQVTPGPGYFSLLAEVSSSSYRPVDKDVIVDQVVQGMVESELLTPEQAASKIVSRQLLHVPYSYPVPTLGRDAALAVLQPWLMERGIFSRGRFGAWRYEIGNTDHSVMMGVELADLLVSGKPETTWALLPGEEARPSIA